MKIIHNNRDKQDISFDYNDTEGICTVDLTNVLYSRIGGELSDIIYYDPSGGPFLKKDSPIPGYLTPDSKERVIEQFDISKPQTLTIKYKINLNSLKNE